MRLPTLTAALLALLAAMPLHAEQTDRTVAVQAGQRAGLVGAAMDFLGVRYRRGGSSEDHGFDCSGFTRHVVARTLGLALPRRADEQAREAGLPAVPREQLRPGDLVFFNTLRRAFSHVGIYVGDGKFIHSPSAGGSVRIEDMGKSYWTARFDGARRVDAAADAAAAGSGAPTATAGSAESADRAEPAASLQQ